jgi:hypothetical protein
VQSPATTVTSHQSHKTKNGCNDARACSRCKLFQAPPRRFQGSALICVYSRPVGSDDQTRSIGSSSVTSSRGGAGGHWESCRCLQRHHEHPATIPNDTQRQLHCASCGLLSVHRNCLMDCIGMAGQSKYEVTSPAEEHVPSIQPPYRYDNF